MQNLISQAHFFVLIIIFAISLFVLSKSSDKLVDNAVVLSSIWGMSKLIIGATVVSLGTTLPELLASVISAIKGNTGFAVGNAVGSIITNTSIVLGAAVLFGTVCIREDTKKKFNMLLFVCIVLIIPVIISKMGNENGTLIRPLGYIFLLMVPAYIIILIRQYKNNPFAFTFDTVFKKESDKTPKVSVTVIMIAFLALLVSISASGLVASSVEIASRLGVPDMVISSTLVAFGTSLPEFSTAISSVKKNYGDLCLGNILGANILNVILVLGASVIVSSEAVIIPPSFYVVHIPILILILAVFGFRTYNKTSENITKKTGILLILIYAVYLFCNVKSIF
ncbi:MAG: sodium:calcium antiporter [Eubacteriaceae bacterium]